MRGVLLLILVLAFGLMAFAQGSAIEKAFEANKAKYTHERFSEGEDASSGYDYLFYKSGPKIVKIRSIWSASWSKELRIEDFYFDGDLLLLRKQTAPKRQLNVLKKGRNTLLTTKEEFHFTDKKLTKWIVGGKAVSTTDPKWAQTEKEVLAQAKEQYAYYKWLKEGKF